MINNQKLIHRLLNIQRQYYDIRKNNMRRLAIGMMSVFGSMMGVNAADLGGEPSPQNESTRFEHNTVRSIADSMARYGQASPLPGSGWEDNFGTFCQNYSSTILRILTSLKTPSTPSTALDVFEKIVTYDLPFTIISHPAASKTEIDEALAALFFERQDGTTGLQKFLATLQSWKNLDTLPVNAVLVLARIGDVYDIGEVLYTAARLSLEKVLKTVDERLSSVLIDAVSNMMLAGFTEQYRTLGVSLKVQDVSVEQAKASILINIE